MDDYLFQGERSTTLNIYFVAEAGGDPSVGDDADAFAWFPPDALPENIAFDHVLQVLADLQRRVALGSGRGGQLPESRKQTPPGAR